MLAIDVHSVAGRAEGDMRGGVVLSSWMLAAPRLPLPLTSKG